MKGLTWQLATGKGYSSFGIAVDRKHALKWLFHHRGPQRLVLVAGVEVKATLYYTQKVYVYSETALGYLTAPIYLCGWRAARGLRTSDFTANSSTGVVPCTSLLKGAPEGTR